MVNVKTLNGSEHDGRSFKRCMDFMLSQVAENISFFFIEKILDFYKILEESEQFFILFLTQAHGAWISFPPPPFFKIFI